MELAGAIITLLGSLILLIAAIGLLRMPDIYTRIQVGTKATTLGTIMTLTGILLITPQWWGKLILIMLFMMITNPVSSHVLARAAHYIKSPFTSRNVVDKLKLSSSIVKIDFEKNSEQTDKTINQ